MKRINWRFPLQVGITFFAVAAIAAYPLTLWGSAAVVAAAVVGGVLSTCNVLAGFAMIEYGFEKSYTTFLKVVLGGMGLRMALMLAMLLLLIQVCHLDAAALTVSVIGFMMVYLILEILYLQRKVDCKNQG
jgi:hypothetical protein